MRSKRVHNVSSSYVCCICSGRFYASNKRKKEAKNKKIYNQKKKKINKIRRNNKKYEIERRNGIKRGYRRKELREMKPKHYHPIFASNKH